MFVKRKRVFWLRFLRLVCLERPEKSILGVLASFLFLYLVFFILVPSPRFRSGYSTVLYDSQGRLLGASIAPDGQWRFPAPDALPEKYQAALVAFEDRRFFFHAGVDPLAVLRALVSNIRSRSIRSGASTISMQVARLAGKGRSRGYGLKIIEALQALRLEQALSKKRILSLYASQAPFGGNVVGLEAAAWRYFGRSPAELSWAEAAVLAVLPNNPALVHPGRNRERLRQRRDSLLERLYRAGKIDAEDLRLARAEPLPAKPYDLPRLAPHLLERAKAEAQGPLLRSSLDADLQQRVSTLLARRGQEFALRGIRNMACLVLDTKSGKVLAYVGNLPEVELSNQSARWGRAVDAVKASRSSGSLLKPFLYAAMLDTGELSPQSLVLDIPLRVGSYSPENNSKAYLGALPADQALARSLNVPAVRELRAYGVERFARLLADMGLSTLSRRYADYGLPLVLGGAEVNLWEMSGLYSSLARCAMSADREAAESAFFMPSYLYAGPPSARHRARISPAAAYLCLEALSLGNRPEEEVAWADFSSARKIAWKTGTSFGFRDAWAIGVSPSHTVAVWVGNADGEGRPEIKSVLTSAPVMFEIFSSLPASSWFRAPSSGLKPLTVCADSGYPAGPDCLRLRETLVPSGSSVSQVCPYCRTVHLSPDGQWQEGAGKGREFESSKRFVLPPAVELYYRSWNISYRPLPPERPDGSALGPSGSFSILFPEEGSAIYIPIELSGRPGRAVFQAAHRDPQAVLHWHIDEEYLGSTTKPHKIEVVAEAGRHRLTLVDQSGQSLERRFSVLNEH